jgi:ABC-type sugar transport system permease subunit
MKKKKASVFKKRQGLLGYMFLSPWLIGFLIFTAIPFVYTIYISFYQVSLEVVGWTMNYVGIDNYNVAFLRNPDFVPALIEFMIMEVTYAPVIVVIAFILALLLNRNIKMRAWFRALFFLPVIVMSGPVMYQLADSGGMSQVGIIDMTLYRMVEQFWPWLAERLDILFANYSMMLWFTGIPIVLFLNGLQKIDVSILEAAKIDSATSWQILWKITVPIIRPVVMVAMIFTIVQLGIYDGTLNPVMPLIQTAIYNTVGGLGLASAYAWVYSAVVLVIIGLAFAILKSPKEKIVMEQKRLVRKGVYH